MKVELLHIQFRNPDGHLRRLIGMREFQDSVPEQADMQNPGGIREERVSKQLWW